MAGGYDFGATHAFRAYLPGHETPLSVLPAEVLPDLEGGDHSKGKQSGLVGASVSPTGGQDWQVLTRYQTYLSFLLFFMAGRRIKLEHVFESSGKLAGPASKYLI